MELISISKAYFKDVVMHAYDLSTWKAVQQENHKVACSSE